MFAVDRLQKIAKMCITSLIAGLLVLSLASCGDRLAGGGNALRAATPTDSSQTNPAQLAGNISEVSPPEVIQQLRQSLEMYQPQVKIISPQADQVLQDDTVTARFDVKDLPIFKNPELDLGPHLHVILDNQPYIAVYDLNQPLVFPDLAPGTHTLRIFASRPWHESFKNEGAYAQTTFHIFTKTDDNNPAPAQPLLTYSRPKGSYGAEPILLDFYLTNAPLHLVAQENPQDEIADWRIRCTINGSSFVIDRWEPIYLQGFKPGKNWVQLEFLDEKGDPLKNVFNNTVRVITYEPQGKDTLSKLVRGELSADATRSIVEPYTPKAPEVTPTPTPTPEAPESVTPIPIPTPTPSPAPAPESINPSAEEAPAKVKPGEEKTAQTEIETQESAQTKSEELKKPKEQKPKGFFNRRRSTPTPPTLPEVIEPTAPESTTPEVTPPQEIPEPQPSITPDIPLEPTPPNSSSSQVEPENQVRSPATQKLGGYFNRLRRSKTPDPNLPPTLPEIVEPNEPIPELENSNGVK